MRMISACDIRLLAVCYCDAAAAAMAVVESVEGRFVLTLRGRCMEPLLFEGDRAVVLSAEHLQVGDLALVLLDGGLLAVHRIVGFEPNFYITKGDYSGKAERVGPLCVLGIARGFSLEGGPWVEDPRPRHALVDLAGFSITMCSKGSEASGARRLVWHQNKIARKNMTKEAERGNRQTLL